MRIDTKYIGVTIDSYLSHRCIGLSIISNIHSWSDNKHIDIILDMWKYYLQIRIGAK